MGYNDGLSSLLISGDGGADVLVRGRRAPLLGTITMDYAMVDVTDVPGASVGDAVTLIGADGDAEITVPDRAAATGMTPYEVTCGIGRRVKRVYLGGFEADA